MKDLVVEGSGVAIALRDHGGDGRPVILIPGGTRNLCDWTRVAAQLTPHRRVIAIDKRGHGQSGDVDQWDWDEAARDIDAVVDALHLHPPVVVGHSMGGMLACHYAASRPGCPGAVNVDGSGQTMPSTWPGIGREEAMRFFEEGQLQAAAAADAAVDEGSREWMEAQVAQFRTTLESGGLRWDDFEEASARAYVRCLGEDHWRKSPGTKRFTTYMQAVTPKDMWPVYRAVKCPLLLVLATREDSDPDTDRGRFMRSFRTGMDMDYERLLADRPNVRIERVGCGHMVPLERPDELAAMLAAFA